VASGACDRNHIVTDKGRPVISFDTRKQVYDVNPILFEKTVGSSRPMTKGAR
jgi:hypothetical protein